MSALRTLFSSVAAVALMAAPAVAAADEAKDLVEKVFERSSWNDMQGSIRLTLKNKRGDTKVRQIRMWSKKNERNETSMLMSFVQPADVRGTGFLTIEHDQGEDDRRLYLPALRRVQRISASGSGGNFMSSDFTYYDIGRPKLEDWTYRLVEGKTIDGIACKAVEGVAANDKVKEDTGYSKVIWFIDPSRLIGLATDYFDRSGTKLKEMKVLAIEDISGTPFATHMVVKDVTTEHQSELLFEGLKTDQNLPDKLFTERNLRKRVR